MVTLVHLLCLEEEKSADVDAVWISKGEIVIWKAKVCGNGDVCGGLPGLGTREKGGYQYENAPIREPCGKAEG